MKYSIFLYPVSKTTEIGSYEIDPMPGCPRIGISHGLYIKPEYRGQGHGIRAMSERLEMALKEKFEVLICTVKEGNLPEEKILKRFRWRQVTMFENLTTGNTVNLYVINLGDPYREWLGECR